MGTYRGVPAKPVSAHPLQRAAFDMTRLPRERRAMWLPVERSFEEPFAGLTTDGVVQEGLRSLRDDGFDPAPAAGAARELLATLSEAQRDATCFPVNAEEWRRWTNAYPTWAPHGLFLQDVSTAVRDAVVELMRSSLGTWGFEETRNCMKLNETLGEIWGDCENLGEWTYRLAIFGQPSVAEPWGWQLHGHHVDVSWLGVGRQMCLSPIFLGAEPRVADNGRFAGLRTFDAEELQGLELRHALTSGQLDDAVLFRTMRQADLPPLYAHPTEGRHRSGAGQDNLVLPFGGLCAGSMTRVQRELLGRLVDVYLGRWPAAPAAARRQEVEEHLDETWVAFVGTGEIGDAMYYRVHSPAVLIEFDHHRGVFLDNPEPEPYHVHTIVRTPNGGDYGRDLLRLHYETEHTQPASEASSTAVSSAL